MTVTRVTCRTCHRIKEVSPTGAVLWTASAQVCSMCHEASEAERSAPITRRCGRPGRSWKRSLSTPAKPCRRPNSPRQRAAAIGRELDQIHADLEFLRKGRLHNIHYADRLTRACAISSPACAAN